MEASTDYRGVAEAAEVAASGGFLSKVKYVLAVNYGEEWEVEASHSFMLCYEPLNSLYLCGRASENL